MCHVQDTHFIKLHLDILDEAAASFAGHREILQLQWSDPFFFLSTAKLLFKITRQRQILYLDHFQQSLPTTFLTSI